MNVMVLPEREYGDYRVLMADRSGFQSSFCRHVLAERARTGRVLDIGCGPGLPEPLAAFNNAFGRLDGVDPDPGCTNHPFLVERWCARLEDSDVPDAAYDMAYSYNVVEHIDEPVPFMERIARLLKPGGVFWALTPHAQHPFCWIVRTIDVLHGRRITRRALAESSGREKVNPYKSYYRMNTTQAVLRSVSGLGFSELVCTYYPCLQWDTYMPVGLRWIPHLYDRFLGTRFQRRMLIFMFRLRKGMES